MNVQTRRNLTIIVSVLCVGLWLSLANTASGGGGKGMELFQKQKCSTCHSVKAAGIEAKTTSDKMKGPDLSGYELEVDIADLAAFLRKEAEMDGTDGQHKTSFKGTDEELQAIIDWLGSLEAQ